MIFHPAPEEMYPKGFCSFVDMDVLTKELCGLSRPVHFRGVCTVGVCADAPEFDLDELIFRSGQANGISGVSLGNLCLRAIGKKLLPVFWRCASA